MAILYLDGKRLLRTFRASARWLLANEQELNDINVFPVPDGDTGTNMGATLRSIIGALEDENAPLPDVAAVAARAALTGARGNSGVILSQVFRGFADGVGGQHRLSARDIAGALKSAYEKAYAAVSDPREGTILTVVRESAEAAARQAQKGDDIITMIEVLCAEARRSLMRTPDLLPALKEAGVVDAGAMGYVYFVEGILKLLKGEHLPDVELIDRNTASRRTGGPGGADFGYCTELFIRNASADTERIRSVLTGMGESIVVAGSGDMVKVHIHSQHPGRILEKCLGFGLVSDIKIENMDEQHAALAGGEGKIRKDAAVIAVALGEGLHDILMSLGCDYVVSGGQTMNPSVEDITAAIRRFDAGHIYILPNNGNVVAAAEQAAELAGTGTVTVVPSRSVPEGCAALLAFDAGRTPAENMRAMADMMASVRTGEVTAAARTATVDGISVSTGDIIALSGKKMLGTYADPGAALQGLVAGLVDGDSAVITVYYGADVDAGAADAVRVALQAAYPGFDVEMHSGGQPHYHYLVSVE